MSKRLAKIKHQCQTIYYTLVWENLIYGTVSVGIPTIEKMRKGEILLTGTQLREIVEKGRANPRFIEVGAGKMFLEPKKREEDEFS